MNERHRRLVTLQEAMALDRESTLAHHQQHLNPRMIGLLNLLGLDRPIHKAQGLYFWDSNGRRYLDFLGGFASLSLGHNPPEICSALETVRNFANLVEGLNPVSGALAANLSALTDDSLPRVYFGNCGAEAVDAAIKLSRAATGRARLISCRSGFHGRSVGALSLMDRAELRHLFLPLLDDVSFVSFGDIAALEAALRKRDAAGFLVEPIQGEAGIILPPPGYLQSARELCTKYGTIFIADEIQTGIARTGTMFAVTQEQVVPDVLLLGKALGGGVMPISALLTSDELWRVGKGGTPGSPFHNSTFGGNTRACAAGLATIEVVTRERMAARAEQMGDYLMGRLSELQEHQAVIAEVRGRGLMIGIEFALPTSGLVALATGGILNRLSYEYFAAMVLKNLAKKHRIMTMFTLNNPNVLRLEPPLIIGRAEIDYFVDSLDETLSSMDGFLKSAVNSWREFIQVRHA